MSIVDLPAYLTALEQLVSTWAQAGLTCRAIVQKAPKFASQADCLLSKYLKEGCDRRAAADDVDQKKWLQNQEEMLLMIRLDQKSAL